MSDPMEMLRELRTLALSARTAKEAKDISAKVSRINRTLLLRSGIGLPATPLAQAQEYDSDFRERAHLTYLSDRISMAVKDVQNGKNRMVMVSMPPRSGKSTLLSLYTPLWLLRLHPEWSLINASHDGSLSGGWARQVRRIIEDNPGYGIAIARDSGAATRWETVEGGGIFSSSIRTGLTGRGARVMIIDDPVKDYVDAHSRVLRQNLWDWWLSVARTRLEPPYLVIVVMCMTGDTPVLRSDGTETPLRDIRPGDEVATFAEDGTVTSSRIVNWANQGQDDIFALSMASGRTVRANARHPFLIVDESGAETWVRLESLKVGMKVRSLMEPTEGSSALPTTATNRANARACVCRTTTRLDGRRGFDLPRTTRSRRGPYGFVNAMGSRLMSISRSLKNKMAVALSVRDSRMRLLSRSTGPTCSASITATTPASYGDCSVTTATSSLLAPTLPSTCDVPPITWLGSTDEIMSIEPAGYEDVFDIEVEGTHNFIANGLCASNTRWHQDDFIGRLLSPENEGDPEDWENIRLPAIAESGDILGRNVGEPLISPLLDEIPSQALERWDDTKRAVGSYTFACTPSESPILMGDWTTKPISEVQIGDQVIGIEKGTPEHRSQMVRSTVLRTMQYKAPVQTMTMESGNVVRCTADHRWYTGRKPSNKEPHRKLYSPAVIGTPLLRISPDMPPMSPQRQRDLDWIAGMFDGEGHFRSNVATITQSSIANPDVYLKLTEVLARLGWDIREEIREPEYANSFRIRDTRRVFHELLERTFLGKRDRALAAQWSSPRKPVRYRDRVTNIESGEVEQVHALETSTGNYVVWGYASSNSMYQQRPAPARGAIFMSDWWRFWTSDPNKVTDDGRITYLDPSAARDGKWLDSWDCTFKGSEMGTGDYVVGQRWMRRKANRFLIMQKRKRMNFTQTLTAMREWAKPTSWCGNLVHQRLIENAANGPAIMQVLQEEISGIKSINATTSKEARARAVTPEIESGNVYLPHPSDPGNEWVGDLLSELNNFPYDSHDDQVDSLTQALSGLRDSGIGSISNPSSTDRVIRRNY